ncbi:hypothetical protein MKX03_011597, partial [Papaver bracteatum]
MSRGDSDVDAMEMDDDWANKKLRLRSQSRPRSRSSSRPPGEIVPGDGFRDALQKNQSIYSLGSMELERPIDVKIAK